MSDTPMAGDEAFFYANRSEGLSHVMGLLAQDYQRRLADAAIGAALTAALASAPVNVDLQISRTGEVCLCNDVPETDATRALSALLSGEAR